MCKSQLRTTWFRQQRGIGSATELLVCKSQVRTSWFGQLMSTPRPQLSVGNAYP